MLSGLLQQHLLLVSSKSHMFSLPRSAIAFSNVISLTQLLEEPATKKRQLKIASAEDAIVSVDVDMGLGAADDEDTELLFFEVLDLPKKKTVQVPVAAGGHVSGKSLLLAPHDAFFIDGGNSTYGARAVDLLPSPTGATADPALVLSSLGDIGDFDTVADILLHWPKKAPTTYHIPGPGLGIRSQNVCTTLIQRHAFVGRDFGIPESTFAAGDLAIIELMIQRDYAVHTGSSRDVMLTKLGLVKAFENQTSIVDDPALVTLMQQDLPFMDCTSFELTRRLMADGWTWAEYLAPSKRPADLRGIVDRYELGLPKVMKTTLHQVSKSYLLALLKFDELNAAGLTCLPHGQAEKFYESILRGDLRPVQDLLALESIPTMPLCDVQLDTPWRSADSGTASRGPPPMLEDEENAINVGLEIGDEQVENAASLSDMYEMYSPESPMPESQEKSHAEAKVDDLKLPDEIHDVDEQAEI